MTDVSFEYYASLRYQNQEQCLEVPIPKLLTGTLVPGFLTTFHEQYQREYTYQLNKPVQLVSLRLVAKAVVGNFAPPRIVVSGMTASDASNGRRLVDFDEDGVHEATVFDVDRLEPGMSIRGPAVVEGKSHVTMILPLMKAFVDDYGNLLIDVDFGEDQTTSADVDNIVCKDAFTEDILQNALQAAAREMFIAMRRTAMSAIIYEVLDFGTAILDASGELASSGAGIPVFVGMLHSAVKQVIAKFSVQGKLFEGDIFALNDPYRGGATHLNDICLVMPIFAGGESDGFSESGRLVGWAANLAHFSDVGGLTAGSMSTTATEIYQEGLNLPGIKLLQRGVLNEAVLDIMLANSRLPEQFEGDLWAAIASVRTGDRRVRKLVKKYGIDTYLAAVAHYLDYGEAVVLHKLHHLPNRAFQGEEEQHSGITYRATVEFRSSACIVDLTASDNQDCGPFNLSRDCTVVCAMMFLKSLTSPQSVCNAGTFRRLEVRTRRGSVFDPSPGAAQGYYFEVAIQLYDLLWRAVATELPKRLPAGHFASICSTVLDGTHPDTGRRYCVIEPELGGWGASCEGDGTSAMFSAFHGDTFNLGPEIAEALNGVLVQCYSFSAESGGHGCWRGGRGVCIEYRMRADDARLTFAYNRSKALSLRA
eukprot:TRINITY_DN14386_c0_g2_i2.p1 TRINITY_DN14386_c0_g2~~TRINITY_DN14386_c0_g2_i2.p1  ORF type:complete len:714 (-),score=93.84 TRINITY_DN14386_c0_g2_i2:698-2641(-)